MGAEHKYVRVVGLQVTDQSSYADYRKHMIPILHRYGGDFEYDFQVAEVLKQLTPEPINRLFVIVFRDQAACEGFFADAEYLAVRQRYFEAAVGSITQLAAFSRA